MATSIPPHNAGELCAALLHADRPARAAARPSCCAHVPGPDFPTGGVLVEPPESIAEAYRDRPRQLPPAGALDEARRWATASTRSSSPRSRIRCQKGRLIEKIAALLEEKKLPLLADVRDEFDRGRPPRPGAEDPQRRCRAADGAAVPADRAGSPGAAQPERARPAGVPRVMSLGEALQAFLDHRRSVLQRRSRHRLAAVARRIEVLRGLSSSTSTSTR